jgi:hypothetical protein
MAPTPPPISVNRAPVLTLWAAVVAERLGYPPETALTLGRFVAGSSVRAKARGLGIIVRLEGGLRSRLRARLGDQFELADRLLAEQQRDACADCHHRPDRAEEDCRRTSVRFQ